MLFETSRGLVAVRSTSEAVRRHLVDGLPATAGAGPGKLPRGMGIRPADVDSRFHWLYWGRCPVARTRDAERLVSALEHHLGIPTSAPEGRLLLQLTAGVDAEGKAFLLPRLGADAARFDRRLRDVGATLFDGPFATVDVIEGELVVEPPAVRLSSDARAALLHELGTHSREPTIEPGRYPIARWLSEGPEDSGLAENLTTFLSALAGTTSQSSALLVSSWLPRLRKVVINVRDVSTVVDLVRGGVK